MITAYGSVKQAVEALKAGALDYVIKPFDVEELKIIVAQAGGAAAPQENILLKKDFQDETSFENMIGKSRPMREVFSLIEKVAVDGLDRPHHRRERDGQGDGRPGHPRPGRPARSRLRLHQLRGPAREPPRERALRARPGLVHRGGLG